MFTIRSINRTVYYCPALSYIKNYILLQSNNLVLHVYISNLICKQNIFYNKSNIVAIIYIGIMVKIEPYNLISLLHSCGD